MTRSITYAKVNNGLKRLSSAKLRQITRKDNNRFILTPLGTKCVREQLSEKLTLSQ